MCDWHPGNRRIDSRTGAMEFCAMLTLAELEALAGILMTVLLALDIAGRGHDTGRAQWGILSGLVETPRQVRCPWRMAPTACAPPPWTFAVSSVAENIHRSKRRKARCGRSRREVSSSSLALVVATLQGRLRYDTGERQFTPAQH